RCATAAVQIDSAQRVTMASGLPQVDQRDVRGGLSKAMTELRNSMQLCSTDFKTLTESEKAEELRGYGIGRAKRVQDAIAKYRPSAQRYFRVTFNQQYWPSLSGAGATPSAH